ncbi:MAG: hypothetical protein GX593_02215 [Actinomycetales bacterium]|nr:hypothetical protein [Actinomycetales bacterium]
MTTPTLAPMLAVTEYARRVREHLADLAPDDVTELTEGMEADLVEAILELPGADPETMPTLEQVEARFGPPAAYAAELRAAAGLPSGTPSDTKLRGLHGLAASLRTRERNASRELQDRLAAQPWWPGFRELALTMRPVWWVLRAYVLAMIGQAYGAGPVPDSAARWLWLLVLLTLSVQWGRGRIGTGRLWSGVGLCASVLAALVALPVIDWVTEQRVVYDTYPEVEYAESGPGVFMDGEQVRSFHAFDPQGNPIEEFLLFDDLGRPVVTVPLANDEFYVGGSEELWHAVPPLDVYGTAVWNSYPLQLGRWNWLTWDEATERWVAVPASEGKLFTPVRPFERAIPLEAAVTTGEEEDVAGQGADDGAPATSDEVLDGELPGDSDGVATDAPDDPDSGDGAEPGRGADTDALVDEASPGSDGEPSAGSSTEG